MTPERPTPLDELWTYLKCAVTPAAAESSVYDRREDVIYGRKDGMALTLDVFAPKDPAAANGLGLLWVVSGFWLSSKEGILTPFVEPLVARGYTVFAVLHSSQPEYAIPDILPDIHRAVRFVRHRAADFGIDPGRIGIYGGSAGGHLALMQAVRGEPGRMLTADPVERASSRVQAAACFFPPTDFLNFGGPGEIALGVGPMKQAAAAFAFHCYDEAAGLFRPIEDDEEILAMGREISPAAHASADSPPTLLYHGDADPLVPFQQSERMAARLGEAGAVVELKVKRGGLHGWPELPLDLGDFADWFDRHLGRTT